MASDRLLEHIKKGVSIAQVARVIKGFADQGILVHAYLMCGFPTETVQATVDSLEVVRLLFAEGCLHLGYWHRLEATGHSPIGMEPEQFGIQLRPNRTASNRVFAWYPIPFKDPTGVDHAPLDKGLRRAMRRYHHGLGLDRPVHEWFPEPVSEPTVAPGTIALALATSSRSEAAPLVGAVVHEDGPRYLKLRSSSGRPLVHNVRQPHRQG